MPPAVMLDPSGCQSLIGQAEVGRKIDAAPGLWLSPAWSRVEHREWLCPETPTSGFGVSLGAPSRCWHRAYVSGTKLLKG